MKLGSAGKQLPPVCRRPRSCHCGSLEVRGAVTVMDEA